MQVIRAWIAENSGLFEELCRTASFLSKRFLVGSEK